MTDFVCVGDEGSEGVRVCERGSVRVCESLITAPLELKSVLSRCLIREGEEGILFVVREGEGIESIEDSSRSVDI